MVSGPSTAPLPARFGALFGDRARVAVVRGPTGAPWRRFASLHDSLFLRTRGEGRAVHHACRAADVRCRETELARSAVAGDALELVQQLCAAPWVSRRLSRMGHLADGRAKYVAEVQKTGRAKGFRVACWRNETIMRFRYVAFERECAGGKGRAWWTV